MILRPLVFAFMLAASVNDPSDEERNLITKAVERELEAVEDIAARFKKNKLTPTEKKLLFGKETSRKVQEEMLLVLQENVAHGRASCRMLKVRTQRLGVGDSGILELPAVNVLQVVSNTSFHGEIGVDKQRVLFRGFKADVADGDAVKVTIPLIVIGRTNYQTVAGGTKTIVVVESLAVAVERLERANATKK